MKNGGLLITLLALFYLAPPVSAQTPDTFETWVNREPKDSLRLMRAIRVAKYFENIDTNVAWKYLRLSRKIADSQATILARMSVIELEGILLTKRNPAQAYAQYQKAIELTKQMDTSKVMRQYEASLLNNLGVVSYMNGDYEGAINSFSESVRIYEKYGDPGQNLPPTLNNIASTYTEINYYPKAIEYARRGLQVAERIATVTATSYIGVANALINLEKFDSAFVYLQKGRVAADKNKNQYDLFLVDGNMGAYYEKVKKYDSSLYYHRRCLPQAIAINSPFDISATRMRMAAMLINTGKLDEARRQIDTSAVMNEQHQFRDLRKDWYDLQSAYFEEKGDLKQALDYRRKFESLKDSIMNENRLKRIDFLEERYQADKKQSAITKLENDQKIQALSIRQKSILNYILVAGLIVLAVIGFLLFRNFRHKQQLSKQTELLHARRIRELEQEKQLISLNYLLKGQEEERGRLAKDLHDGLGGMLSGVKLSLGAMKGNLILSEDNARLFTKALNQLDNSISEMRRVAHNMMPEALVRLGLQQAVQDYCDNLSESQSLKIDCQFHGLENRLDGATEIIVYRIVQELLNNSVKHGDASHVLVQIMRHENNLNITVEDNGKGFSVDDKSFVRGAGLSNIRSRVDYLKGNLDIQSSPGKGTSVHIDCII